MTALLPSDPSHSNHLISTGGLRARRARRPMQLKIGTQHDIIFMCQRNQEEICGFLTDTEELFLVKNAHHEPKYNFYMDQDSLGKVIHEIHHLRQSKIVGIFHTHPNNQPWPSPRDIVGWPNSDLHWRYWIATQKELIEWELYTP